MKKESSNKMISYVLYIFAIAILTVNIQSVKGAEIILPVRALWDVECNYGPGGNLTKITCHSDGQYECDCPDSVIKE